MRKGPMDCPSCLDELTTPIVADASVVINLIASGFAATILGPLGSPLRMPGEVQAEIESGRSQGREDADKLAKLIAGGQVAIVDLGATGIGHFASLVTGAAQHTLDDGEAAAIAYALEHRATVLIDEKKATRLCAERFGHLTVGSTSGYSPASRYAPQHCRAVGPVPHHHRHLPLKALALAAPASGRFPRNAKVSIV